jgi:hypothetical protein
MLAMCQKAYPFFGLWPVNVERRTFALTFALPYPGPPFWPQVFSYPRKDSKSLHEALMHATEPCKSLIAGCKFFFFWRLISLSNWSARRAGR